MLTKLPQTPDGRPGSVGIMGNAHEMMIEKNSGEVVRFVERWIRDNVR